MGLLDELAYVPICIASPSKILEWTYGEVTKPEHVCSYNTFKRENEELFCERIFGVLEKKNEE